MATRKVTDPNVFCDYVSSVLRRRGVPRFIVNKAHARCLVEATHLEIPGLEGLGIFMRRILKKRAMLLKGLASRCRR